MKLVTLALVVGASLTTLKAEDTLNPVANLKKIEKSTDKRNADYQKLSEREAKRQAAAAARAAKAAADRAAAAKAAADKSNSTSPK